MRGHIRQRGAGWVVVVDHGRDEAGRRKQKWYSGYKTKKEAEQALTKTLAAKDNGERLPEAPTKLTYGTFLLEKWLPHLENRVQMGSMRESTYAFYADIVNGHIVPNLGSVRLRALDGNEIEALYAELLRTGRKVRPGEPPSGLGMTRVRAIHVAITSSLKWAVRQHLRTTNPASEVSAVPRPSTDQRPCWTPEQTATFLAATQEDRLYPLYLLAATTGMRRGEVVGLHWEQVDLDAGQVTISRTRVSIGGRTVESTPKTAKGLRPIAIAPVVIEALRAWRQRQRKEHMSWGPGWTDTGFVFTWEDGRPYKPQYVLRSFQRAAERVGLPVVAFHGSAMGRPPQAWPPEWRS